MKTKTDAVLSAKSLKYFLQLIDSMSYTQASQILGITQPALTQQIKKIERAVGAPLFGQIGKKTLFNRCWNKNANSSQ
ncbi:helix-turn-helix domain-containing protein [Holzapfeliella floricola]|uniref:helix-turn-helix domain-containing protein n=1 Tax=Holzapfeliella floricola TaxID=679249 RepID=UPI000AC4E36B|nr:LysR family transcriptional regulator [Holzapfeliella floricola]